MIVLENQDQEKDKENKKKENKKNHLKNIVWIILGNILLIVILLFQFILMIIYILIYFLNRVFKGKKLRKLQENIIDKINRVFKGKKLGKLQENIIDKIKDLSVFYNFYRKDQIEREGTLINTLYGNYVNQFLILILIIYITLKKTRLLYIQSEKNSWLFTKLSGKRPDIVTWITEKIIISNSKVIKWEIILIISFIIILLSVIVSHYLISEALQLHRIMNPKISSEPHQLFRYLMKYLYFSNILYAIFFAIIFSMSAKTPIKFTKYFIAYSIVFVAFSTAIYPWVYVSFMNIHKELKGYTKMFDFWFITKNKIKVIVSSFTLVFLGFLYKEDLIFTKEGKISAPWALTIFSNFMFVIIYTYFSMRELWELREEYLTDILAQKIANKIQVSQKHIIIIGYEATGRLLVEEILNRNDLKGMLNLIRPNTKNERIYLTGFEDSDAIIIENLIIIAKEGGNIKFLGEIGGVKVGYVKPFTKIIKNDRYEEVIVPVLITREIDVPSYQRICNLHKASIIAQTLGDSQISQAILLSYLEIKTVSEKQKPKLLLRVQRAKEKRTLENMIMERMITVNRNTLQNNYFLKNKDNNVTIFLGKELAGANSSARVLHFYSIVHKLEELKPSLINTNQILIPFIGTDTTIGNYITSFLATYGFFGVNPTKQASKTNPIMFTDSKITQDLINKGILIDNNKRTQYKLVEPSKLPEFFDFRLYSLRREQRFLYKEQITSGYFVPANLETSHIYFRGLVELYNRQEDKWIITLKNDNKTKKITILFPLTILLPGNTQVKTIKVFRNFIPIFKFVRIELSEKKYFNHYKKLNYNNEQNPKHYLAKDRYVLSFTRGLIDHKFTVNTFLNYLINDLQTYFENYFRRTQNDSEKNQLILKIMEKVLTLLEFTNSLGYIEAQQMAAITRILTHNKEEEAQFYEADICNPDSLNLPGIIETTNEYLHKYYLMKEGEIDKIIRKKRITTKRRIARKITTKRRIIIKKTITGKRRIRTRKTKRKKIIKKTIKKNKYLHLLYINAFHCGRNIELEERKNKHVTFVEVVVQILPRNINQELTKNEPPTKHCDLGLECMANITSKSDMKGIYSTDFIDLTKEIVHIYGCFNGEMPGSLHNFLKLISNILLGENKPLKTNQVNFNYALYYTRKCRFSRNNYLTTIWFQESNKNSNNNNNVVSEKDFIEEVNSFMIISTSNELIKSISERFKNKENNEESNHYLDELNKFGKIIKSTDIKDNENGDNKNGIINNFVFYFKNAKNEFIKSKKLLINPCLSSEHLPFKYEDVTKNSNDENTKKFVNNVNFLIQTLDSPLSCPIAIMRGLSYFYNNENQQNNN